jgi:hypothetical protein
MFRIILIVAITLFSLTANASSWRYFHGAFNDKTVFYFDADTINKKGDSITLWVKNVRELNSPDVDGSYATAMRMVFSCKKRTSHVLSMSSYDKTYQFKSSNTNPTKEEDIAPDTIGEVILKDVCAVNFPKSNAPVKNNDIYTTTADYFKYDKASKIDIAPTEPNWYMFNGAYNDSVLYFFDAGSIDKNGNNVNILVKFVKQHDSSDKDGIYSSASNEIFICNNKTNQSLFSSYYNKDGQFKFSLPEPGLISTIKPGTLIDAMLNEVCNPDFPQNVQTNVYTHVDDVYVAANNFFDYIKSKNSDPAPK